MADMQIVGKLNPEGGGLPIHATQFQIVVDVSDVTLVFMQRSLEYGGESAQPIVGHRIIGQISLSHMLAKDLRKQLTAALANFEIQYPIPEIKSQPLPTNAPVTNAKR